MMEKLRRRVEEKPSGPRAASWLETGSSAEEEDFVVAERGDDIIVGVAMMLLLLLLATLLRRVVVGVMGANEAIKVGKVEATVIASERNFILYIIVLFADIGYNIGAPNMRLLQMMLNGHGRRN